MPERDDAKREPEPTQIELERLEATTREAREEAAPFALTAAAILASVGVISKHAHWSFVGHEFWWLWLIVAVPYALLGATLLVGLGRFVGQARRRKAAIALLALVWVFNLAGTAVLVASLVAHSGVGTTGAQLLVSGGAVWLTNVLAFGLAFWELDCGGPVARALATERRKPDFQFPQDDNPEVARDDWAPRLWDYLYVSMTNSIAFSPTDTLPLTRPAKALMAGESAVSAVLVLLIAARAVNILP